MRRLHANYYCPHTDPVVFDVRRQHDTNNAQGVLEEVQRVVDAGRPLTQYQNITLGVHKAGALFMLGAITPEDFIGCIDHYVEVCQAISDHGGAADLNMWRIRKAILAGYVDLARNLVETRFVQLQRRPEVVAYEELSRAFLAIHAGDADAAVTLCQSALLRLDKYSNPCEYEFISRQLAGLLVREKPAAARLILREANIPDADIESVLTALG